MTTNGRPDRRTLSTDRRDRLAAVAEQIQKRAANAPGVPTTVMATPSGWIVRAGPYRTQDEAEAAQEWINQSFYDIAHLLVCIRDGIRTPVVSLNGGLPGNIRRLRTARGWSLSELASRVCVTENAVQKLESGVNGPKLTTAIALSQAFGVSLSELVGQSNGKK